MPVTALRMKSLSLLPPPNKQVLSAGRSGQAACEDESTWENRNQPPDQKPAVACSSGHPATCGAQDTRPEGGHCPRRPVSLSKNYLNEDSLRSSLEPPQSPKEFSGPAPTQQAA